MAASARSPSKRWALSPVLLLTCLSACLMSAQADWSSHVMAPGEAPADSPHSADAPLSAAAGPFGGAEIQRVDFTIGALLPNASDHFDPSLTREWESAFGLALAVLGDATLFPQYAHMRASALKLYVSCDAEGAATAVSATSDIVGFVGPACSEAAAGAAEAAAGLNVPVLSFAATSTILNSRAQYPTFFRTVFADDVQSVAVKDLAASLNWTAVMIVFTADSYGSSFSDSIETELGNVEEGVSVRKIGILETSDSIIAEDLLKELSPNSTVILVMAPVLALKIFKATSAFGTTTSSWWYLGTDGVTAVDLMSVSATDDEKTSLYLTMQGQVGLAPHVDVNSDGYAKFVGYWQQQDYDKFPGRLNSRTSPPQATPGAYVAHLFDATWALFEAVRILSQQQAEPITGADVLRVLQSEDFSFEGCTGTVQFDVERGDRKQVDEVVYDVVNFQGDTWQVLGSWSSSEGQQLVNDILPPFYFAASPPPEESTEVGEPAPSPKTPSSTESKGEEGDEEEEGDEPDSQEQDPIADDPTTDDTSSSAKSTATESVRSASADSASTAQQPSEGARSLGRGEKSSGGFNMGLVIGVVCSALVAIAGVAIAIAVYRRNSRHGAGSGGAWRQLSGSLANQL